MIRTPGPGASGICSSLLRQGLILKTTERRSSISSGFPLMPPVFPSGSGRLELLRSWRIRQHFRDLRLRRLRREHGFYSLWRLLVNIAIQDKSENIPPNVAGDFMRAILDGTPYPQTLLQAALRRIHSDTENRVKPVRAADKGISQ